MTGDLVIGLDSSTQSTKAVAWTRTGEAAAEGRAPVAMDTPLPGWVEQDPEGWWSAVCTALRQVTRIVPAARVAGLAVSNQRETVAFLDARGTAVCPAMVWLDERARDELPRVADSLGAQALHAITGKPVDITPVLYRLSWLRRHAPETLDATAKIVDVHGYLTGRLTGRAVASWTSADPFGVFDINAKEWSVPILEHLGLRAEHFAELERPGSMVGHVTGAAGAATGLAAGTPVFAAGGDGQCAGLGVDAVRPGVVYLNLGTALITGTWSPAPRISRYWRTMTSPTGEGYFLEGCQRAGAFFLNWLIDAFAGGREDPGVFDRLEAQAARLPIGSEGVTVCPYLTGCMDPHWDPRARAGFLGLGPLHGIGHIYRASLEAMTLESMRCVEAMEANGLAPRRILAVGGGANSRLWTRMFADATGLPLTISKSLEASALGAGVAAAVGAGWFESFGDAATAMSSEGETIDADPGNRDAWEALSKRQAAAYDPRKPVPRG